jgi:hypothetical protein
MLGNDHVGHSNFTVVPVLGVWVVPVAPVDPVDDELTGDPLA